MCGADLPGMYFDVERNRYFPLKSRMSTNEDSRMKSAAEQLRQDEESARSAREVSIRVQFRWNNSFCELWLSFLIVLVYVFLFFINPRMQFSTSAESPKRPFQLWRSLKMEMLFYDSCINENCLGITGGKEQEPIALYLNGKFWRVILGIWTPAVSSHLRYMCMKTYLPGYLCGTC